MRNNSVAVMFDAENCSRNYISRTLHVASAIGEVTYRRAYGNWNRPHLKPWEPLLNMHAIEAIQQFKDCEGENSADFRMTVDAMDMLYTTDVDTYCFVSSDSDFAPIVARLRQAGKEVYGFGEQKAKESFSQQFTQFFYLNHPNPEVPQQQISELLPDQTIWSSFQYQAWLALFTDAVKKCTQSKGWALLSEVGGYIHAEYNISAKQLGVRKLFDYFKSNHQFEVQYIDSVCCIRCKAG